MQVLDSLRIGQNVKEIIECDLTTEISARTLYQEAATHCGPSARAIGKAAAWLAPACRINAATQAKRTMLPPVSPSRGHAVPKS
jgi:hypothetical protein